MSPRASWRIRLYEFLAAPAHLWLLLCAALAGIHLKFGPTDPMPTDPMQIEPRD